MDDNQFISTRNSKRVSTHQGSAESNRHSAHPSYSPLRIVSTLDLKQDGLRFFHYLFRGAVNVDDGSDWVLMMWDIIHARSLIFAVDNKVHFGQIGGLVDDVVDSDTRTFVRG